MEEYKCYHEEGHTCFIDDGNMTSTKNEDSLLVPTVINADGEVVEIESNIKNAPAETAALMPRWAAALVSIVVIVAAGAIGLALYKKLTKRDENEKTYTI